MRRALILAFLVSAATAAPAPKKPAHVPTVAPTPSAAETLAGWTDIAWGMTSADVLARHPDAKPLPDSSLGRARLGLKPLDEDTKGANAGALELDTNVLDHHFGVVIRFRGGRVNSVTLTSRTEGSTLISTLVDALAEKYGAGSPSTSVLGTAMRTWKLPKTEIVLEDYGGAMVRLIYSDATGGNAKGNL